MTSDEIRAELTTIAAEATTWKGWAWAPGMHDETGVIQCNGFYHEDSPRSYDATEWQMEAYAPGTPDFTDPATIGCVFRMVCDRDPAAFGAQMKAMLGKVPNDPTLAWWVHALAVARAAREVLDAPELYEEDYRYDDGRG